MRRSVLCALVVAIGLGPAPPARAQSFLDPDAQLFTLAWPDSTALSGVTDIAALADGSVAVATVEAVRRVGMDGRVTRMFHAGNALAVEASGALIVGTSSGRILRVGPDGSARPFARVGRAPVQALAALDNGELVALAGGTLCSIQPGGTVKQLAARIPIYVNTRLLPLAGARFLVASNLAESFAIVGTDGFQRPVTPPRCCSVAHPLRDGRALVTSSNWRGVGGVLRQTVTKWLLDRDGVLTPLAYSPGTFLGNGDGTAAAGSDWLVFDSAHAADGALVYTDAGALRAAVPASSPRARIAFAQSAFQTFPQGRVAFHAPVAGPVELEVRQGERVVERVSGTAAGPEGELTFRAQPPGAYDLRLRLGTGAEARTRIDTRAVLTKAEARDALTRRFAGDHGDEGYRVDGCKRRDARTIDCLLLDYVTGSGSFRSEWPEDRVSATLRADGIFVTRENLLLPDVSPRFSVDVRRRQHVPGFRAVVRVAQKGRAEAVLDIGIPGRKVVSVRAVRRFDRRGVWRPRFRLGRSVLRAAARRPLSAAMTVTVTVRAGIGEASTRSTVNTLRLRAR